MQSFTSSKTVDSFSVKLWRGEQMVLIGMDVEEPEPNFVGFSIEVQSPGSPQFFPLRNRLNFAYGGNKLIDAVNGFRNYPSTEAPIQKFRWIHFPYEPKVGSYIYRVTKKHMLKDGSLSSGTDITLDIFLDRVVYDNFLDLGFTRNYASSQAYAEKYQNKQTIIPVDGNQGLQFQKVTGDVYQWLGFEAYELIFGFLKESVTDKSIELDCFAYDLNEPDIVALLEQMGTRLRIAIDNSDEHKPESSAESQAAQRLSASAGADHVRRFHFSNLQHNKVLIAKRNGKPYKVLLGSTNFSYRGIYIQANNVLVFLAPEAAALFSKYFDQAFENPKVFSSRPITQEWHVIEQQGKPRVSFCLSPHHDPELSLDPIGDAIEQATSSVFFCIAFLNQATSGSVRESIDRLENKNTFSYGISDRKGGLQIHKPDGSLGIVDFEFLANKVPEPFRREWSGGKGIHEHHKFVVVDFNLPTAKVFTGSSNLSINGEEKNGDHLIMIEDHRIATAYVIEILRIFDHLHFRTKMQEATKAADHRSLTLAKPTDISGKPAWFERFYVHNSQAEHDRKLFAH